MKEREIFSIAGFAECARITRDTLLHYDKIGLLSPESRGKNNYRRYSNGQLAFINFIRTCQALGMTLAEIKRIKTQRTPELIDKLLEQQVKHIDEKIEEWVRAKKLLATLKKTIHSVLHVNEDAITVQFIPEEAIILGELNDYHGGKTDYDAFFNFYRSCMKKHPAMDLNYPAWAIFSEERIKRKDWVWPDRYYFYNPEGHDRKPAALYAIGYTRGGYGQGEELYERLLDYIDANGFEICGPAYEEYPLNEFCIPEDKDYLMRVMITVCEKKADKTSK
ncbi:MAG: MerR family transcriptional regulator [Deltaproteobacteria bacterium]|jgi:DNA-binding transcriptional MerR regulator|nr:MerR family transcriptional regulator [Deltaproteobacteria bacterium]